MRTQKSIPLLLFLLLFVISCETPEDILSSKDIAAELEGQWIVNEQSSEFKKTLDFYYVQIYLNSSDSTQVFIENFYDLGNSIVALAKVNGTEINLPSQTLDDGSTIHGNGTISSDYQQIIWVYYVDLGTGVTNEVNANYEFQY